MFEVWVPGKPRGKDRPRFSKKTGRTFTTPETKMAEAAIVRAWEQSSAEMIDGAVWLSLDIVVSRPNSHYKKNGELNTEGLRYPLPIKQKPDVDNCLKLVMDALNGVAYFDDVRVIKVIVTRVWGNDEGLLIKIGKITDG